MEFSSIAAVIVLYNPNEEYILENIQSCLTQVPHTLLIDNSDRPNVGLVDRLKNLKNASYMSNNGNQGIAHALNVGSKKALELNFEWLLTLDQDTRLPSQFVEQMRSQAELASGEQIGILAPKYENNETISIGGNGADIGLRPILFTMTSGNFLNLKSYLAVGGFRDELFIDHVDHEYCLRLNAHGYKIYETPVIILKHKPGRESHVGLGNRNFKYASHNPSRLYYFCRNGLRVAQLYDKRFPQFRRFFVHQLLKQITKILFFEGDKVKRIKMITKGYQDFKKNKFGALTN